MTPSAEGGLLLAAVALTDATGQSVHLRDFGTAGQNGLSYISWLPAKNLSIVGFARTNPLRTFIVEP